MAEKRRFDVSLRMTVFFGSGDLPPEAEGLHSIRLAFTLAAERGPALVAVGEGFPDRRDADIVFLVDPDGCREVLGDVPQDEGIWHLTTEQRAIALAILDCDLPEPAAQTLRTIRSVELLWAVTAELREGRLVPADGGCVLGELDSRRIMAARRLIDEDWREKLTLDSIARASGLNRVKLTRGFRAMFDCSVAEAIAERRLTGAYQLLLVTDLPVSSVGYRCGYSNNASFARAFSRRFGMAPTQLRATGAAAA
jgi:AraC family transcriptional regulator, transcriptional activator of the genes for pyochelin and ferripyochelin receptors